MSLSLAFFGFAAPAMILVSLVAEGYWSFFCVLVSFGLFPLIELSAHGSTRNLSEEEEERAGADRRYSWFLYAMVPMQYGLMLLFLNEITRPDIGLVEWIGSCTAMGVGCGTLGINVAHELGHRKTAWEQRLSQALLLTSLYLHFFIEHNRGHHVRVATEKDPATARRGESLFHYFPRTLSGSFAGAWHLEERRLQRSGGRVWSLKNQMLAFQLVQLAVCIAIGLAFGLSGLLGFVVAAFLGILLLETVNYVEHYGLIRRARPSGGFERVQPHHSWNSNAPIGRGLLFQLTRHADHHANAKRPYQVLRHFDDAPQLPTGYPGMMVLAWVPPLWFRVMNPRLDELTTGSGA